MNSGKYMEVNSCTLAPSSREMLVLRGPEKYSWYASCGWDFVLRRSTGRVDDDGGEGMVGEAEDGDPEIG